MINSKTADLNSEDFATPDDIRKKFNSGEGPGMSVLPGNVVANYDGEEIWRTDFISPGPNSNPCRFGLSPIDAIDGASQRHD